nr:eIF-2-alpha kinase activator GCN1 isoform X17 [Ipomoea batatas]
MYYNRLSHACVRFFRSFVLLKGCFPLSEEFILLNPFQLRTQNNRKAVSESMIAMVTDKGNSNRLPRCELSSKDTTVVGKKDGGTTKKSAKEEAHEMQLREEACTYEKE